MILLNSKSVLDCEDYEEEEHNNEHISFNILKGNDREKLIQAIEYLMSQNILFNDKYEFISLLKKQKCKNF